MAGNDAQALAALQNRRLGLLTNHTGLTRSAVSTLSALRQLGLNVVALFSPEHGFSGKSEGHIASSTLGELPVHSLYGETRRPTAEMLQNIEVLVCDLQDVGARFYTYASTLAYCMEECAAHGVAVCVLDRPNPIGGAIVEAPLVDVTNRSFIGYLDVPIRHGLTMGELALLHKSDKQLDLELHIAQVLNWRRDMLWPETNLRWPTPSPNLPSWKSALWYPGTCLLEFSDVSVGRGTGAPFQIIGAPWFDVDGVLSALAQSPVINEYFSATPIDFTPTRGQCEGKLCHGLQFQTRNSKPETQLFVPLGLFLMSTLHVAHPQEFVIEKNLSLLGSSSVLEHLKTGDLDAAIEICEKDSAAFTKRRREFLLY